MMKKLVFVWALFFAGNLFAEFEKRGSITHIWLEPGQAHFVVEADDGSKQDFDLDANNPLFQVFYNTILMAKFSLSEVSVFGTDPDPERGNRSRFIKILVW